MEYAERWKGLGWRPGLLALPLIALLLFLVSQAIPISRTAARPVPTQVIKRIAVINDDPDRLETIMEYVASGLTGSMPVPFLSCEALLAAMNAGERFTAYVMDYDMPPGMNGINCMRVVLTLHPEAVVIGNSMSDSVERQFFDNGARSFNKGGTSRGLIELLRGLGL